MFHRCYTQYRIFDCNIYMFCDWKKNTKRFEPRMYESGYFSQRYDWNISTCSHNLSVKQSFSRSQIPSETERSHRWHLTIFQGCDYTNHAKPKHWRPAILISHQSWWRKDSSKIKTPNFESLYSSGDKIRKKQPQTPASLNILQTLFLEMPSQPTNEFLLVCKMFKKPFHFRKGLQNV